jgi:hypothetical protein
MQAAVVWEPRRVEESAGLESVMQG